MDGMFGMRGNAGGDQGRGEGRPLAIFTYALFGLGIAIFGIDSYVTARAMQADPHGYPVRMLIPEPLKAIINRPPPVLMGENAELISSALAQIDQQQDGRTAPLRNDPGAFERAFGNAPDRAPQRVALAQLPKPGKSGMLDIDFTLKGGADSAKAINVRKPVAVAGAVSGNLSIRIDGAARIYARRSEVASLLEGKSDKSERIRTASGDDFVSFEQLRDLGVDIRYDPSADRIVIPNGG